MRARLRYGYGLLDGHGLAHHIDASGLAGGEGAFQSGSNVPRLLDKLAVPAEPVLPVLEELLDDLCGDHLGLGVECLLGGRAPRAGR